MKRRWIEPVLVLIIVAAALFLRLYHLEADPPLGLSVSNDVYTDHTQYTLFARLYVQMGDFNPFGDYRFPFFVKSSVTALAVVVFELLGTGLWQSNFVGFLYAFGALLLFFLFIRKVAGRTAGVIFLLLGAVAFNLIFFGRLPFLEHAMAFWAFLALVLVVYGRGAPSHLAAGASLAVAVLLGKVFGIVFLFPFAWLLLLRLRQDDERLPATSWRAPAAFVVGSVVVAAAWYALVFLPLQSQVEGYITEQSVSLYGAPEGLQSVSLFLQKMFTFADHTKLFTRLPIPGVLASIFIGLVLYHMSHGRYWREGDSRYNAGLVFMAAMIIAFYGSLMIWNYRPLRYQLALIYPLLGGAAVVLSFFWHRWRAAGQGRIPVVFYVISYLLCTTVAYKLLKAAVKATGGDFYFSTYRWYAGLAAVGVLAVVTALVIMYRRGVIPQWPWVNRAMVAVIVLVSLIWSLSGYVAWAGRPTFSARDDGVDLRAVLADGAVVSGPYAPLLSIGTDIPAVIHMFGVSSPDTALFTRFPITHLLMDKSHEELATEDYPEMMAGAFRIGTYHVGREKFRLYRIAGATGNPRASAYRLSPFERAQQLYARDSIPQAQEAIRSFLTVHPENMSGYLLMAGRAENAEFWKDAEILYKKAVEFSPSSYILHAKLGRFYRERFAADTNSRFLDQAERQYEEALHLAPTAWQVQQEYSRLRDTNWWLDTNETESKIDTIESGDAR